jgi:hypothetical protein
METAKNHDLFRQEIKGGGHYPEPGEPQSIEPEKDLRERAKITEYGGYNWYESVAECYAAYLFNRPKRVPPELIKLFDQIHGANHA